MPYQHPKLIRSNLVLKIGLIGCGTIGRGIAQSLDRGDGGNVQVSAIYDMVPKLAEDLASTLSSKPKVASNYTEIIKDGEIGLFLEAASREAVSRYIIPAIEAGKNVMIMSVGAFSDQVLYQKVVSRAEENGVKVYIPTGAIAGLDAIKAASISGLERVVLKTSKPPQSWLGPSTTRLQRIKLDRIIKPTIIFEGNAEEAAPLFPANINVSVALGLAGIGVNKTQVQLVANPNIDKNIHEIIVEGNFGELRIKVENVPSPTNPKTSWLAVLSAIKKIKEITDPISLGT